MNTRQSNRKPVRNVLLTAVTGMLLVPAGAFAAERGDRYDNGNRPAARQDNRQDARPSADRRESDNRGGGPRDPAPQAPRRDYRDNPDRDRRDDRKDDRRDDRRDDNRGGVNIGIDYRNGGIIAPIYEDRVTRVWVEPVYRTVFDRVWVQPEFRTVTDRVWREPVVENQQDRVWVPDRVELRDVVHFQYGRRFVVREAVLIEAAHWQCNDRPIVVRPGYWETIDRQEMVCDGHWQDVQRQELVCGGHFEDRVERVLVAGGRPRPSGFEINIGIGR